MYETKSQLRIITALLIVVIALAAGLFFFMPTAEQVNALLPTPEDPPAQHLKERDAEISLDPSLIFSQTFGGSGEESLVDTFYEDGKLYVFGNTTSTDYDFDSSGAFLAILDGNGKTLGFTTYEGILKAVTLYNGGYALAIERDDTPVALAIDYNGDEIKSTVLPVVREEVALDIQYADRKYLFVTALVQSMTGFTRLKLTMLDEGLNVTGSVLTDEVYTLEYLDTLPIGNDYLLMANALSDIREMLCIGSWGKKLAHYPQEFSYRVMDYWIIGDFYYLAVTKQATLLIKADGSVIELSEASESGCIIGDEKHFYISAGNTFLCVSGDKVIFSAEYGPTSFYRDTNVYAVSENNGQITVRSFSEGNKLYENAFKYDMTSPTVLTCASGMFVIGTTQNKFGGSDITVIKVNY